MIAALESKFPKENLDAAFRYYATKHDFTRTVDLVIQIGHGELTQQILKSLGEKGLLRPSPYKRKLTLVEKARKTCVRTKTNIRAMFCSMYMNVLMKYKNVENFFRDMIEIIKSPNEERN